MECKMFLGNGVDWTNTGSVLVYLYQNTHTQPRECDWKRKWNKKRREKKARKCDEHDETKWEDVRSVVQSNNKKKSLMFWKINSSASLNFAISSFIPINAFILCHGSVQSWGMFINEFSFWNFDSFCSSVCSDFQLADDNKCTLYT